MSDRKFQKNICYIFEKSQIVNALADVVLAKVNIIDNHATTITLLITLVVDLIATIKGW